MSFGTDFAGFDDLDANWTVETDETRVLAYAVARRFITPRGGLFYDPSYGYDLRALVNDTIDAAIAEQAISSEATKDERVKDCQANVTPLDDTGATWEARIACTADSGATFTLTLQISDVTVNLLEIGA